MPSAIFLTPQGSRKAHLLTKKIRRMLRILKQNLPPNDRRQRRLAFRCDERAARALQALHNLGVVFRG